MRDFRIITLGQDTHWSQTLKDAVDKVFIARDFDDFQSIEDFLDSAHKPDPETLLLIDVSEQPSIKMTVQRLRKLGWPYIIVVAADPSVKEAYVVLHDAGGYDYWQKTYQVPAIRVNIERCLNEIAMN